MARGQKKRFVDLIPGDRVSIKCLSNQKTIEAEVVSISKNSLVVVLPGFLRLQMTNKNSTNPNLYVATQAGLEFHCEID